MPKNISPFPPFILFFIIFSVNTLAAPPLSTNNVISEKNLLDETYIHQAAWEGETPLHSAAREGYLEVVELLLNSGAKMNAKDVYGQSALRLAKNRGHHNIVKLLRQYQDNEK